MKNKEKSIKNKEKSIKNKEKSIKYCKPKKFCGKKQPHLTVINKGKPINYEISDSSSDTHSIHSTHSSHSTHSTHSTHSICSTKSSHSTKSSQSTHSTKSSSSSDSHDCCPRKLRKQCHNIREIQRNCNEFSYKGICVTGMNNAPTLAREGDFLLNLTDGLLYVWDIVEPNWILKTDVQRPFYYQCNSIMYIVFESNVKLLSEICHLN